MTTLLAPLPRLCGLLLLAALLPACAQRVATPAAAAPTPAANGPHRPRTVSTIPINTAPGDTVLVFQRTPCYGTCPSYTATIFRNGQVSYNGERSVPVMGPHMLSLPPATVAAMLAEARRVGFSTFEHRYASNVSDLPATIITVYQPGQQRYQVFAEGNIPPALQGYISYLKGQFDPLAGIGVDK